MPVHSPAKVSAAATRTVQGGNLGATPSLALTSSDREVWLVGTLNVNATLTITGLSSGQTVYLLLTQDATGGRTLSITAAGSTASAPVSAAAQAVAVIACQYDGTDLYVAGHGGGSGGSASADIAVLKEAPINFTESRVGGVGDDATNNDAAWTALNTLLPARGGAVIFPPGVFRYNTMPSFSKPVQIEGSGGGIVADASVSTLLKPAPGVTGLDIAQPAQRSSVRSLFMRSRSTATGTDDGIRVRGHAFKAEHVVVENFGRDGISVDTSGGGNANLTRLEQVRAHLNRGKGFLFKGVDSQACVLDGCDASANGGIGYHMDGVATNTLLGCHADNNAGGAFVDSGSSNVYLNCYSESGVGNTLVLTGAYAFWVAGSYATPAITQNAGGGHIIIVNGRILAPDSRGIVTNVGGGGGIAAGGVASVTVTFPAAVFPNVPSVIVAARAGLENAGNGECYAYLIAVSTTGFTARVKNASSAVQTIDLHWSAFGG